MTQKFLRESRSNISANEARQLNSLRDKNSILYKKDIEITGLYLYVKMETIHIKGVEYLGFLSCNYLNFNGPSSASQMPWMDLIYTKPLSNRGQTQLHKFKSAQYTVWQFPFYNTFGENRISNLNYERHRQYIYKRQYVR